MQKADRCPCSASPVSAAGSGSAAQPSTLLSESPCRCAAVLLRLANFPSGPQERPCENWSAAPGCRCPNMQRGSPPACENRSAAPNTAPCFVRRTRSLCLPLLRLACFCRRQRLGCAASFASLFLPQAALGSAAPLRGKFAADCSFFFWLCRNFQASALRLLRSLHPGGAVCGQSPTGAGPQGWGTSNGWGAGFDQNKDRAVCGKRKLPPALGQREQ